MNRKLLINVLLILAGIVLAIALFGAGVLWESGAEKVPRLLSSATFVGDLRLCGDNWVGHQGERVADPEELR